jgi:hypothetical protein
MTGDPFGGLLHQLFTWLFLGPARVPDMIAFGALLTGLATAVSLPFPVRPVPVSPATSRQQRVAQRLALLAGLAVPGAWDLMVGRAALGALQALGFGLCYAVARAARGEGFLAQIVLAGHRPGYFGDQPAGVPYLASPGLADLAGWLTLALFLANLPLTLWRARAAGVLGGRR